MTSRPAIDNLKQVKLEIMAGADPKEAGSSSIKGEFEFIFGVGSTGISPFEKALYGKEVGDQILMEVNGKDLCQTFVHLEPPQFNTLFSNGTYTINIIVKEITDPTPTEIVKAMANTGKCGGADCDCCGH